MIAILGGLGAAVAALCASSSSREIGAMSTLAWVMSLGLCVIVVPLALVAHPSRLSGDTVALLCIAGLSNIAGLHLEYVAFRRVAVGIVTAVAATEGMVAAVLSSLFGARLAASTVVLLAVITVGVVLAAAHLDPSRDDFADSHAKTSLRSSWTVLTPFRLSSSSPWRCCSESRSTPPDGLGPRHLSSGYCFRHGCSARSS
jgi:drug/metabolite transporter (DMT)-like permease